MTKNTPWECFTLPSTLATQTLIRKNKNPYKSWHPWLWLILRKKHTANMNRCPVWPFQSTPHFSDQSIWKKVRIIARVVASGTSTPLLFDYTITKPIYIYIYIYIADHLKTIWSTPMYVHIIIMHVLGMKLALKAWKSCKQKIDGQLGIAFKNKQGC